VTDEPSVSHAWEKVAEQWAAWARKPGHDSYWRFHRDAFFDLLPVPGRMTIDIGCGEGRVARDLKARGHNVVAIDVSPTMVRFAREADPSMTVLIADAAQLPFEDGAADLAVAFMSFQDVDDMPGAVREASRVLVDGGVLCLAVVHPINAAGNFEGPDPEARFVIAGSYFEPHRYVDHIERDGLPMTFTSWHWPLQSYFAALHDAGFIVEILKEVTVDKPSDADGAEQRWSRIPLFLDLRARRR
jgi:ubiquinone/menaquinone biosynthesis C-methylase UbiE